MPPETVTTPRVKVKPKTERPKLHKVILVNDDFTPREFVVMGCAASSSLPTTRPTA